MDILGVDIGGVIVQKVSRDADTSFFSDNYLNTPAVENAFATIRLLSERRYGKQVYLVSKCGPKVEAKTIEWLEHQSFYTATGVLRENVRFCRERIDKAPICSSLGINCFIDDRTDVLRELHTVETRLLFAAQHKASPPLTTVKDWDAVCGLLLPKKQEICAPSQVLNS